MADDLGRELGWDDEVKEEGGDFEPLPAGTYDFTIASMERGRFPGSEKMVACNKASLDLIVKSAEGKERHVYEDLLLNSKLEWKLSQFFTCIGQKKPGEPLKPNWGIVPGATGKVELYIDEYKNKKTEKMMKINRIDKWLPPEQKTFKAGDF